MTTARQKLLGYLRKNRAATPREMARALDMTAANVRHHLAILLEEGGVTVSGERREGRGRPVKLYSLSGALAGDNLPGLLDAALSQWLGGMEPEQQVTAIKALGERLGQGVSGEGATAMKQLAGIIEGLNKLHYAARWEAGAEGPRLILSQCPYAALIAKHPELCQVDAAMLEVVLSTRVEQRSRMQPACVFVIQ